MLQNRLENDADLIHPYRHGKDQRTLLADTRHRLVNAPGLMARWISWFARRERHDHPMPHSRLYPSPVAFAADIGTHTPPVWRVVVVLIPNQIPSA
jgi:hypothetical protein